MDAKDMKTESVRVRLTTEEQTRIEAHVEACPIPASSASPPPTRTRREWTGYSLPGRNTRCGGIAKTFGRPTFLCPNGRSRVRARTKGYA